ncbi:peptidoglycan-binding protein [Streptomyces sp. NPDC097617]|uniref:peptidoglycan-binding protein n=1 Tax=Streptomyces sp. NPDC097617 TaxID=3366091 RepID=UPI003804F09B
MNEKESEGEKSDLRTGERGKPQQGCRRVTAWIAVVTVAAACGALTVRKWPTGEGDSAKNLKRHSTTPVQRTSLASGLRLDGRLGHSPADEISVQGQGTFTQLPKNGDHVQVGKPLYEIDAQPVILFRGTRPFWRALATGMSNGPDIRILERNLADLGYADSASLTVDDKFTDATAAAVKRWQKAIGVRQTGAVEMGRVAVLPYGDVWVEEVVAKFGTAAGSNGPVLKVTTPDVYATIKPSEEQLPQLLPGSEVTVQLDAGSSIRGEITSIKRDTTGDKSGDGSGERDQAKSTVTIRLDDQKTAAAALSSGRVGATVTVPEKNADNVLVVPVTALLAKTGGGYGIEIVKSDTADPEFVAVEVGLIVANQAEVKGQLKEGDKVVVPK